MRVALAILTLASFFGGCTAPAEEAAPTALVLRYTLIDTGAARDYRYVDAGPHCSTAHVVGNEIRLASQHFALARPGRPFLVVLAEVQGDWLTTGSGGWAVALPADLDTGIEGERANWTRIRWSGNHSAGHVTVDGFPIDLPHEWTRSNPGADWRIEARLERGPDRVQVYEPGPCD